MYSIENSIAKINGANGVYNGIINDSSVRYGRNSVNNMQKYLSEYSLPSPKDDYPDLNGISQASNEEFSQKLSEIEARIQETDKWLNSLPPLEFEQRYMPNGKFDKMALMGAAYEEMAQRTEMPTEELTQSMQEAFGENVTAEALDLNQDKKIDLAEYSTSILLSDALSTNNFNPSANGINGIITNKGQDSMLPYANKKNYEIANKIYRALYDTYNLGEAQKEFTKNQNNMVLGFHL